MSEEKESKKCKHGILHGWGEFCHNCVIESLESRLKEANRQLNIWTSASKDWLEVGKQSIRQLDKIQSLELRLSQAEAERDGLLRITHGCVECSRMIRQPKEKL